MDVKRNVESQKTLSRMRIVSRVSATGTALNCWNQDLASFQEQGICDISTPYTPECYDYALSLISMGLACEVSPADHVSAGGFTREHNVLVFVSPQCHEAPKDAEASPEGETLRQRTYCESRIIKALIRDSTFQSSPVSNE